MRKGDVGNGHVQDLHDRRQHDANGDQAALQWRALRRRSSHRRRSTPSASATAGTSIHASAERTKPGNGRSRPVSIATKVLIPVRRTGSPPFETTAMRTGMRCTILTQFPVAFCGGMIEKLGAGGLADTFHGAVPLPVRIGVDADPRGLPHGHVGEVGFLEVGFDPDAPTGDHAHDRVSGGHVLAQVRDPAGDAGEWRPDGCAIKIERRIIERRPGLERPCVARDRNVRIATESGADLGQLVLDDGESEPRHFHGVTGLVERRL